MKKHKLFPFLRWRMCNSLLATLLATTLSLAGCTADDNETAGEMLPEGKYPLTFTATQADATDTASPQTRVSENTDGTSSHWDGGEKISVQIGDATETGTYTLDADGTIKTANKPLYWQSTAPQTVTAWYSNISGQSTTTNNTVKLNDQRSRLAYVMKATASNVAYNTPTPVSLKFQHQLAKVRVKLTGEKANDVTSVTIKNYTSCTVNNGDVIPGAAGNISMRKGAEYWEANVVPQSVSDLSDFIQLNGTVKATVSSGITTLEAGKMYTIELTVNKKVDFNISTDEVYFTDNDSRYTVTGTGTKTITINGSPTVTLKAVTITAETAIRINGGTPTIVLEGENKFIANGMPSVISLANENAHVIIEGNNSGSLSIKQSYNGSDPSNDAIIGGAINSAAGNITIQNATLTIDCSEARWINAAIIGSGFARETSSCGNIVISNTDLTIKANRLNGACIGAGFAQEAQSSCGDITITLKEGTQNDFLNNKLTITQHGGADYTQKPDKVGKGGAKNNGTSTCGTVTWK